MMSLLLYVGPGLGGGIIAIIVGILLSVFFAIVSLFWKPIKKLIGLFKSNKSSQSND